MSKLAGKLNLTQKQRLPIWINSFKIVINAQMASAGPPLGPRLGQFGLNIGNFCKDFNERTKNIKKGTPLPITVRLKPDRTYIMDIGTPNVTYYLKQAAGIQVAKIPEDSHSVFVGKLTLKHIYEISKIKYEDPFSRYQVYDFPKVVKKIMGIAYLNRILVVKDLDAEEYQTFLNERHEYLKEVAVKREELFKAKFLRTQKDS